MDLPQKMECFAQPAAGSIPTIIRSLKSAAAKRINDRRSTPGAHVWQRSYHERIVHDENELDRIRRYIVENPMNWLTDIENPRSFGV